MDPIAIILLIIVLISVIAWVIAAQRLKTHSDDGYKTADASKDKKDASEAPIVEEPVAEVQSANQNTIYQNHIKVDMICCPHCDGENLSTAVKCGICGATLS